ncbi:DUF4269 domain-containing protein [Sphingobacterium paludis]|uniref:Uncharacterized protein DUF4269 n=1 Tax=Sphingobacterium paludis TaxID=1476465 RepID=A0A4R7CW84_9SPHI|nr:DUF4269 domain-containing protein [Sphingobacterium paludis]TDS12490.1 uncharacterized protein DUF4269 [Sphingobacterium paludis]
MHASNQDKFEHIGYLRTGTLVQRNVYELLEREGLFMKLQAYTPVLAGTIPLDICIPSSDIDILCCADDLNAFQEFVQLTFASRPGFSCSRLVVNDEPTVLAIFTIEDFAIEIFAQQIPVQQQNGYMHLVKEWEILTAMGQEFKQKVIALKLSGIKTEPAFAHLLRLTGDPYEALLNYTVI